MGVDRGFTLLELLIVVAILGIVSAIAIPSLRAARHAANGGSAIQSLRNISTAEALYKGKTKAYGTMAQLAPTGILDNTLAATGTKSGYQFTVTVSADFEQFTCNATPIENPVGLVHYFVDETNTIRFNNGAPADATSPAVPQ